MREEALESLMQQARARRRELPDGLTLPEGITRNNALNISPLTFIAGMTMEYFEAMTPDIQAEIIETQRQLQRPNQAPAEMDAASILATLSPRGRRDTLLSMGESDLLALSPAIQGDMNKRKEDFLRLFIIFYY